jgi:hypothetical protein
MTGGDPGESAEPGTAADDLVRELKAVHRKYWTSLR